MHFSNCSWCCCPKSPICAVHVPRLARTGYLVQYNVRWLFVCKTGAMHYRNLSQLLIIGYITYISIVIACTGTASGVGGTLAWLQGRRRFFEHGVCSFFFLPPPAHTLHLADCCVTRRTLFIQAKCKPSNLCLCGLWYTQPIVICKLCVVKRVTVLHSCSVVPLCDSRL
jgi:hypothetical protein